jgi:hypothetical protein
MNIAHTKIQRQRRERQLALVVAEGGWEEERGLESRRLGE